MESAEEEMIRDRENDWPRSILVLLGLAIIGLAFLFLNWVREDSPAATLFNRISYFSQPGLIRTPYALVTRSEDLNLAGATVVLNSVRVESVLGDYVFMIDLGEGKSMPVFLFGELTGRQTEERVQIEAGQKVYIFGFLLPLNKPALLTNPEFIDPSEHARLLVHPLYISAMQVIEL